MENVKASFDLDGIQMVPFQFGLSCLHLEPKDYVESAYTILSVRGQNCFICDRCEARIANMAAGVSWNNAVVLSLSLNSPKRPTRADNKLSSDERVW
jgi:hypothetical protein